VEIFRNRVLTGKQGARRNGASGLTGSQDQNTPRDKLVTVEGPTLSLLALVRRGDSRGYDTFDIAYGDQQGLDAATTLELSMNSCQPIFWSRVLATSP
jgi:hypothetical protein